MYGSVFNFENTTSQDQELDLFNSSDQSGGPSTITYTFNVNPVDPT